MIKWIRDLHAMPIPHRNVTKEMKQHGGSASFSRMTQWTQSFSVWFFSLVTPGFNQTEAQFGDYGLQFGERVTSRQNTSPGYFSNLYSKTVPAPTAANATRRS
jgi:hypothetical protein